jgi:hypothetical protein
MPRTRALTLLAPSRSRLSLSRCLSAEDAQCRGPVAVRQQDKVNETAPRVHTHACREKSADDTTSSTATLAAVKLNFQCRVQKADERDDAPPRAQISQGLSQLPCPDRALLTEKQRKPCFPPFHAAVLTPRGVIPR